MKLHKRITKKRLLLGVPLLMVAILLVAVTVALTASTTPDITSVVNKQEESTEMRNEQDIVLEEAITENTREATPSSNPESLPVPVWPVLLTSTQASSLTVVVNKKHKLPSDYSPSVVAVAGGYLRAEAAGAVSSLLDGASKADVPMKLISSYRSYQTQVSTYNGWVTRSGQAQADTFSARPGHSEHQLGLAADLGMLGNSSCDLETCFGDTNAGKWLAANAHLYGFIIRYPAGKQSVTGYQYEPWHIRYVGLDVAKSIVASGLTMDEYYNNAAGDYN